MTAKNPNRPETDPNFQKSSIENHYGKLAEGVGFETTEDKHSCGFTYGYDPKQTRKANAGAFYPVSIIQPLRV